MQSEAAAVAARGRLRIADVTLFYGERSGGIRTFAMWRCWRGPSWMNTAWLLVPAMRELGYAGEPSAPGRMMPA